MANLQQKYLAKVRALVEAEDRTVLHADIKGGMSVTVDLSSVNGIQKGDVIYLADGGDSIEIAPSELWHEDPLIGVVKHNTDDVIIVDVDGRLRRAKNEGNIELNVGNTVELSNTFSVLSKVHDEPIRSIDLKTLDQTSIGQFKAPVGQEFEFEDFGGYSDIITQAKDLITLSIDKFDELKDMGARIDRGVLFYGPPGTGKTMLAQMIASKSNAAFYHINGPEIVSKWYGQSEELIRLIFEDAAAHKGKSIIFFDEIDSIAAKRTDDSHEQSKRIVAQLLTCLDGLKGESNTFVIATTNRKQDIDVALLRPGRFDKEIVFQLPLLDDRIEILRTISRRMKVCEDIPYEELAAQTEGWAPAELEALMTQAAHYAVMESRGKISTEDCVLAYERLAGKRRIEI